MSYTVTLQPSGKTFTVDDGQNILDAALVAGITLPYGCRGGGCGSCRGKVLEGKVFYPGDLPKGISADDDKQGYALFCQGMTETDLVIEARESEELGDIPVRTLPCRVVQIDHLAHDVIRLKLKLPAAERLQFLAGQYLEILLKSGERRAFSMANAPHDDEFLELHIRHVDGGAFTDFVFESMQEKALLRFEGPHGQFYLREDSDRPMIFMAGGTGFAPIKGIIEHAIAEGCTRPIHLYWGARARSDVYLEDLAQSWADTHDFIEFIPVLSEPAAEDDWQGRTGFVHDAIMADFDDLSGFDIYAGGPPPMVYAGRDEFIKNGMDEDHYYSDAFEYGYQPAAEAD